MEPDHIEDAQGETSTLTENNSATNSEAKFTNTKEWKKITGGTKILTLDEYTKKVEKEQEEKSKEEEIIWEKTEEEEEDKKQWQSRN